MFKLQIACSLTKVSKSNVAAYVVVNFSNKIICDAISTILKQIVLP